jgi:hypothetical protein
LQNVSSWGICGLFHSLVPGQRQPVRKSSGIKKAKGQPIICVDAQGSAVVFKLASIEDRDILLTVLNPLKDAATKAQGPPVSRSIPTAEVQAAVFAANPNLRDMHQRCVLSACTSHAMQMSLFRWHFDFGGVAERAWVCKRLLHISRVHASIHLFIRSFGDERQHIADW